MDRITKIFSAEHLAEQIHHELQSRRLLPRVWPKGQHESERVAAEVSIAEGDGGRFLCIHVNGVTYALIDKGLNLAVSRYTLEA